MDNSVVYSKHLLERVVNIIITSKFPGGRTLLDGACNVRTPSRESYPNRGSRRLDSNPKRGTLKQNFTPKHVDFLGYISQLNRSENHTYT